MTTTTKPATETTTRDEVVILLQIVLDTEEGRPVGPISGDLAIVRLETLGGAGCVPGFFARYAAELAA